MSETPAATAPASEAPPTDTPEAQQGEPADLGDAGAKALKAERARASAAEKTARALQAQLDDLSKASLTDLERAQRERDDAKAALETLQRESLRLRVQAKHGITDEDAELFLTAADEDTLTRQAERLAARQGAQRTTGNVVPREGSTPTATEDPNRVYARNLFGGSTPS